MDIDKLMNDLIDAGEKQLEGNMDKFGSNKAVRKAGEAAIKAIHKEYDGLPFAAGYLAFYGQIITDLMITLVTLGMTEKVASMEIYVDVFQDAVDEMKERIQQ